MSNLIPVSRKEQYLSKIDGMTNKSPDKTYTKEEYFFSEILGEALHKPVLETRYEMYLAKIAGREIGIPYPETRLERFLAKAAGMNISVPTPITREEMYWSTYSPFYLSNSSGTSPLTYGKCKIGTLSNYQIYGNTVSGESVGDRTGNLFDINSPNVQKKCYYDATGQKQNSTYHDISDFIPCGANNSYTLSFRVTNDFFTNYGIFVNLWDNQKNFVSNLAIESIRWPYDINKTMQYNITPLQDGYITFNYLYDIGYTTNIMLVEGSTALPYEPYGYKVPMTVEGKNLLPNADWVEGYIARDGRIVEPSSSMQEITSPFVKVIPGKTYVFSYYPNEGEPWKAVIYYTEDKMFIKRQSAGNSASPVAFTVESGVGYVRFSYRSYGDGTFSQLELGDTVTDYEPYHAPVTTPIYLPEPIKMVGDEAEYIDYGEQKQHRVRKNLLPNTATSQTVNGITFTVNSDGSVTCNTDENGATKTTYLVICKTPDIPESTNLILSGCPKGGGVSTYALQYSTWVDVAYTDIGNGISFTKYDYETYPTTRVAIRIYVGCVCDNLTFYPTIRLASIKDDTYEPYIENTDLDVTLPALPTLPGTNTLSVGTEVQPSHIFAEFDKEREYG